MEAAQKGRAAIEEEKRLKEEEDRIQESARLKAQAVQRPIAAALTKQVMNREANRYEADYERNQKRAITIELLKRQQRKLSSPIKALKVNTVRSKKMHTSMGDKLKTMSTIKLSNMINSRNQTPESS
jgi:hypothetical protein